MPENFYDKIFIVEKIYCGKDNGDMDAHVLQVIESSKQKLRKRIQLEREQREQIEAAMEAEANNSGPPQEEEKENEHPEQQRNAQ